MRGEISDRLGVKVFANDAEDALLGPVGSAG
jgi:hypothetical protein